MKVSLSMNIRILFLFIVFGSWSCQIWAQTKDNFEDELILTTNIEAKIESMAERCWSLRESHSDSAIKIGLEAIALAEKYNLPNEISRIYNYVGVVYIHYLYDAQSSISYFHKALEISLLTNDSIQLGFSYNNLGDAFMLTGNAPLAQQYAQISLVIFRNLNYQAGIAYSYVNMGLVARLEKNYEEAIRYFNLAKSIRTELDDKTGIASNLIELARTYKEEGKLEKAMLTYEESYKQHVILKNYSHMAHCLNGMADIYYRKGNYDEALDFYTQSVNLNLEKNHVYAQIDNHLGMAKVYAKQNKVIKGEKEIEAALEIATSLNLYSEILKAYQTYSIFYQILDDYKKATQSLDVLFTLYDSLLSIQKFVILKEIENNFFVHQNLNKIQDELESTSLMRVHLTVFLVLLIGIIILIIWRLRAQRKLNLQLKQVNQSKDKLFSVISHDLKNPFNSIIGFSDVLIDELQNKDYERAIKHASIIQKSSEENLKLLNNLLNWSRAQTGRIAFNPDKIWIKQLFKDLNDLYINEAEQLGIKLEFKDETKSEVFGDLNILRIVITNLISNALKFTKENGIIEVIALQQESKFIIKVKDNGIGMSDLQIKDLLDGSSMISTDGLNNEKGTGLGLIICKEFVEIHNGKLKVKSEIGKGSVFEMEFPD